MKKVKLSRLAATIAAGAMCLAMGVGAVACSGGGTEEPTHNWATTWSNDANNHWYACTDTGCTEKKDEAKHVDADKDDKCDVCKYELKTPGGDEDGPGGEQSDEFTITFVVGDHGTMTGATTATTVEGKLASLPQVTANTGWTFNGWFTAATGGTKVETSTKFDASVSIYAQYTEDEVKPIEGNTIELSESELTIRAGYFTATLTATLGETETITWEVSEGTAVTVDSNGKVTAIKPGTATVTATLPGGASDSCEVTVEAGYYILGGTYGWTAVGSYDIEKAVYFEATETAGIYKTKSFELRKNGRFKVGLVGNVGDDTYKDIIDKNHIADDDEYLVAGKDDAISVADRGMYTITLDTTGDSPVVTSELDDTLPVLEDVYYLFGTVQSNNWSTVDDEADAEYKFTKTSEGVYTLENAELEANALFKIQAVGQEYDAEIGAGAVTTGLGYIQNDNGNFKIKVKGTYTITITVSGDTKTVAITSSDVEEPQEVPYAARITFANNVKVTIIFGIPQGWGLSANDLNSGVITIGGQEMAVNSTDAVDIDASTIDVSAAITVNGSFMQGGTKWLLSVEDVTFENGATYKFDYDNWKSNNDDGTKTGTATWTKI